MQGCTDRASLEAVAEELRGFLEEVHVEEEEALFEVRISRSPICVCSLHVSLIKPAGVKLHSQLQPHQYQKRMHTM